MITSRYWRGALASAGLAVTGGLLANLFEKAVYVPMVEWMSGSGKAMVGQARLLELAVHLTAFVLTILLFLFFLRWLSKVAGEALDASARVSREQVSRDVLVTGLSLLPKEAIDKVLADAKTQKAETIALPKAEFSARIEELRAAGQLLPFGASATERNVWQQQIRAMWAHKHLKKVFVLPSKESAAQFEAFKTYATSIFHNSGREVAIDFVCARDNAKEPFDLIMDDPDEATRNYEAYEYVDAGLRRAVEQASEDGWPLRQVCIDATAGQKTFSIAAAIVTLNTNVVFSYVNNEGLVSFYDLGIDVLGLNEGK